MKKFICGLSAIAVMAMPLTAYAVPAGGTADDPDPSYINDDGYWVVGKPDKVNTSVGYEISPSFTVTIPASIEFTKAESTISKTVTVNDVTLPFGSFINVSITGAMNCNTDSDFNLANASDVIPYSITAGEGDDAEEIGIGDNVVSFCYDGNYDGINNAAEDVPPPQGSTAPTSFARTLTFEKAEAEAKFAGRYFDALEFTVKVFNSLNITYETSPTDTTTVTVLFEDGDTWDTIMKKDEYKDKFGTDYLDSSLFVTLNGKYLVVLRADGYFDPVRPTDEIKLTNKYDARNYG